MNTAQTDEIYAVLKNGREIALPLGGEIAGVESDENAKSLKFKFPKTVDGIDFTHMQLKINFINSRQEKGQYLVKDITPDEFDENYITFTWFFSRLVTNYKGITKFIICAVKTDDDGKVISEWNTALARLKVLEGLEIDNPEIDKEETDVISQLISLCNESAAQSAAAAQKAEEEAQKVLDVIPTGGTKGQVLTKLSDEDRDYNWGGSITGENGATFTPSVSADGIISWTNDKNLPNPQSVAIKGDKGEKGDKGDRGETGVKGEQGQPGADGKTPVKGVDYWNEEDKAEMVESVLSAMLRAEVEKF